MTRQHRFGRILVVALLPGICFAACAGNVSAAPVFADFIEDAQNVTYFDSGILTGAPDDGGAFLSNTFDPPTNLGFITAGFTGGVVNGPGIDIVIYDAYGDTPTANEFADVFVSNNGTTFTFLGNYGAGVNSFDLNGVFASIVNYVKIVNTATQDSPDIDAFQGNYAVPEPSSLALLAVGLCGLVAARQYRRAKNAKVSSAI